VELLSSFLNNVFTLSLKSINKNQEVNEKQKHIKTIKVEAIYCDTTTLNLERLQGACVF